VDFAAIRVQDVVANHLSRLIMDIIVDAIPIAQTFLDEQLMCIAQYLTTWFANIVNYFVTSQMPLHWGQQYKSKFLAMVKYILRDDPYLFQYFPDHIIRGVFLSITNPMTSPFVMIMPPEAISVLKRPLQRFYSMDFTGRPFSETLISTVPPVSVAKS
jgi:hypothetical protein